MILSGANSATIRRTIHRICLRTEIRVLTIAYRIQGWECVSKASVEAEQLFDTRGWGIIA